MKKGLLKGTVLTLAIAVVSIIGVSAKTSIYSNTKYSINAGATKTLVSKLETYTGAEAEVTPFSITSGTSKTTIQVKRAGSNVVSKTDYIDTTSCTYFKLGTLNPGGLTFVNSASGFAGWSGWLKITAN